MKNCLQALRIAGGVERLVRLPQFARSLLEQRGRESPNQAHVRTGIAIHRRIRILAERHIEYPVQFVFDRPMATNASAQWLGRPLPAADVIVRRAGVPSVRFAFPIGRFYVGMFGLCVIGEHRRKP